MRSRKTLLAITIAFVLAFAPANAVIGAVPEFGEALAAAGNGWPNAER